MGTAALRRSMKTVIEMKRVMEWNKIETTSLGSRRGRGQT
jgi:hypothetical protein